MSNKKTLKLVQGVFNTEDAAEILLHLFDKKINFHQCRIFSTSERFGTDDTYSRKRIAELLEARNMLKDMLETARLTGKNLEVHGDIQLSLSDLPTTTEANTNENTMTLN